VKPIVVDGIVVAQRGETVGGRVVEAQKAGRATGVSRLGIQLTELTLADGQPLSVKSHYINHRGPTSEGRDAAAIAGTTALGAAAGAVTGSGAAAGIGAGAGAVVGIVGVLLTRGYPTVIQPESVVTFQLEAPATLSTEHAPQAFRYMEPEEYDRPYDVQQPPPPPQYACAGYGCAPPPPYSGYYWPGFYPYWGGVYFGPSFFYGRGFYGRSFYGRGFHR
jgi:hypothetical protein